MANLGDPYPWLKFLHIVGVLVFAFGHGVSAAVSFRLHRERDVDRIRTLLELSRASYVGFSVGFVWILITGSIMGAFFDWWRMGWFWAAIIILFGIGFAMTPLVAIPYRKVRHALGLKIPFGRPKGEPPKVEEVPALLAGVRVRLVAAIGYGGLALLLWLMVFKPF